MTETIPEGSRVRVTLDCVVDYDDGSGDVRVRPVGDRYAPAMSVAREAISHRRAPIQKPGAKVWHVGAEAEFTVVLHDAQSESYVLRTVAGQILAVPDNDSILPLAEWRALNAPEGTELAEVEAPAPPPEFWEPRGKRPIGTDLGAEDVF